MGGCQSKPKTESSLEDQYPKFAGKQQRTASIVSNGGNVAQTNGGVTVLPSPVKRVSISEPPPSERRSSIPTRQTQATSPIQPIYVKHSKTMPPPGSPVDYEVLEREAHIENYRMMEQEFTKNPQQFIVNQLLLSVQLFKNFER